MFSRKCRSLIRALIPTLAIAAHASAQPVVSANALDSALQHAGLKRNAMSSIVTRARGTEYRSAEVQGFAPDFNQSSFHQEWLAGTISLDTVVFEHHTARHDGTARWRRWIHADSTQTVADFFAKFAGSSPDPRDMSDRARLARRIPHLLLAEIHRNRAGLRSGRDTTIGNVRVTRIDTSLPGDTGAVWIDFSRPGWHVLRVGHAIEAAGIGPAEVVYEYSGYKPHATLGAVPSSHTISIGGKIFRRMSYEEYDHAPSWLDSLTRMPVQLAEMMRQSGYPRLIVPGLYAISGLGGYTVMFQEFADHVVALEAPAAHPFSDRFPMRPRENVEALSRRYIGMIRTTIPGKPIRYVVPTHFHSDHAGGIAAFMREGATVLSPSSDAAYYRALAKSHGVPDSLIRISPIDKVKLLSDRSATLELHSSAGNPHTKDGVIAWWPAHRILYQGDLFYYTGGQSLTAGRDATHRFFGTWLRQKGICPSRVYGTHSSTHGTPEELRLAPVSYECQ